MSTHGEVPPPNEVHPAYAGNAVVNDWVNGAGPFTHLRTLRLPTTRPIRLITEPEPVDIAPVFNYQTLDLHTCWGKAPYVGPPFVYAWRVAVDELGRMVAGEAWRQYVDAP